MRVLHRQARSFLQNSSLLGRRAAVGGPPAQARRRGGSLGRRHRFGARDDALLASAAKLLSLALAVVSALAGSSAQAFVGSFDGGGRVGDYLALVAAANASDERVEIAGVCASACTMKLGARRVCVYNDAQLWFHAPHNDDGRVNPLAILVMLQEYPRRVRAWARATGALDTTAVTAMSGIEAITLGVPACERPSAAISASAKTSYAR